MKGGGEGGGKKRKGEGATDGAPSEAAAAAAAAEPPPVLLSLLPPASGGVGLARLLAARSDRARWLIPWWQPGGRAVFQPEHEQLLEHVEGKLLKLYTVGDVKLMKLVHAVEKLSQERRMLSLLRTVRGEVVTWAGRKDADVTLLAALVDGFANGAAVLSEVMELVLDAHIANVAIKAPNVEHVCGGAALMWNDAAKEDATGMICHLDAKTGQFFGFGHLSRAAVSPTVAPIPYDTSYGLQHALRLIGIGAEYLEAVVDYAATRHAVSEGLIELLMDAAPMLSHDWLPIYHAAVEDGKAHQVTRGTVNSGGGALPHGSPAAPQGVVRLLAFVISAARGYQQYDTTVQHHRSQVCIQFQAWEAAVHWLWKDLAYSLDADVHWMVDELPGFAAAVKGVVRDLEKCETVGPSKEAVCKMAKKLACAWSAANDNMDCPVWAPGYIRAAVEEQADRRRAAACGQGKKAHKK
jgi:hypothetical protein